MFVETKKDGEAQKKVSHEDFIAWLRTKNQNDTYDFMDKCGACAIGQYMAARGIPWNLDRYEHIGETVLQVNNFSQAYKVVPLRESRTFGELLQRMLALRAAS